MVKRIQKYLLISTNVGNEERKKGRNKKGLDSGHKKEPKTKTKYNTDRRWGEEIKGKHVLLVQSSKARGSFWDTGGGG